MCLFDEEYPDLILQKEPELFPLKSMKRAERRRESRREKQRVYSLSRDIFRVYEKREAIIKYLICHPEKIGRRPLHYKGKLALTPKERRREDSERAMREDGKQ